MDLIVDPNDFSFFLKKKLLPCGPGLWSTLFHTFLQEKPDIRDKDDAKPLMLKGGGIQFDNVHFRYDDGSFFVEICLTSS
jgi:hypothetical protein